MNRGRMEREVQLGPFFCKQVTKEGEERRELRVPQCGLASHWDHFLQAGYEGGRREGERAACASVWFGFWRSPVFVIMER